MMRSMALELEDPPAASSKPARTMADTKSRSAGDRPAPREDRASGDSAEAFDIWLQQGLHRLYDSVAKEPVPDELLKLIEQDRTERSK
jgi:Anti-sigma factor NepR